MCNIGVSTRPGPEPVFHVYVHIAPYTYFGSIVGASYVLYCYRQLGLICDAHSASLHMIVILERKLLLHRVMFILEYLCMNRMLAYINEHSM